MGIFSKLVSGILSPYSKQDQLNANAYQQYCQSHGYTAMPGNLPAGTFTIAGSTSAVIDAGAGIIMNGFGGTIEGSSFLACQWGVRGSDERSDVTDYFQMGAIKLMHSLPSVIVRPIAGPLSSDNQIFNNLEDSIKVQLEGDFNKYFEVYSSSSNPVNAFEFLPPDVMARLIDGYSDACVELSGEYLYLFTPIQGATSGDVSLVLQPTFDPTIQDAFLGRLLELVRLFDRMNQTNSPVVNTEIIKNNPGFVINLNK